MNDKTELNISEILAILNRRRGIFLALFFLVFLSAVIASFFMPPLYRATAKIIVQNEPSLYAVGFVPHPSEERAFLNTQKEIISSVTVIEKALAQMQQVGALKGFDYDRLKKKIDVEYLNESNVLQLRVHLYSANDAFNFANAVVESFFDYQSSAKAQLVDKILAAVKKETSSLKDHVDGLKVQLKELSDKEKLSFYQAQIPFYMNNIQELDRRNMSVEAGIERLQEELKMANREKSPADLSSFYPIMSTVPVTPSVLAESNIQLPTSYLASVPWLQEMKKKVADSQTELSRLLGQYTEEHPEIREMRNKIGMLQGSLVEELKKVLSNYNDYYAGYIQYLQLQKKENEQEKERYRSELERLSLSMNEASAKHIEFYALLRHYETMQDIYSIFLRKQNELQFLKEEALKAGVPNIRVLEYATLPKKPFSPNLTLNAFLGALFGMMLGTAGAMIQEKKTRLK